MQNLTVTIETATSITWHYTYNVIADTERGKNTSVVVVRNAQCLLLQL